jgi:hypothetical protein
MIQRLELVSIIAVAPVPLILSVAVNLGPDQVD